MNQEQYQWLLNNGYDPAVYDVDDQGNIFENPIAAPATQKKMSALRAAGTSFLGSLAPSAAGLYAGAQTGALGGSMFGPVGTVLGGIGGGLAGGYGAGKLQEAALERFAPSVQEELARAQTDQPVFSYLGGFAPNALALRPSLGGLRGLTAPLMSMERDAMRAAFTPAAVNVGANVAGSTAAQLVDMSQGGEFSAPRFAADVALGSLFSDPTRIGRRLGLQPLTPETAAPERLDLAGRRGELAAAEAGRAREAALAADEAASARATELLGSNAPRQAEMFGPDARRFDLAENQRAVNEAFDKLGLEKNPEVIQDYVNDPMLSNFRDDPAAVLDYVSEKSGLKARSEAETAASEARRQSEAFETEYAGKPVEMEVRPLQEQIVTDGRRTEIAENRRVIEETLAKSRGQKLPPEVVQDLANDPNLSNIRDNPEELTRFIAEKADKYLENSWQRSMEEINQLGRKLEQGLAQEEVALIDREQERAWAAKEQGIKDIASELETRFQREGGEGQITQADLDTAAQLAARRGLKLQFTTPEQQAQGLRGAYLINEAGERIIYIDANAATRDTAIHEIGHDVFVRSAGERMKRSLMQTAEDSPAFKAEYEARLAEGKTEAQARDLALEEGVIQAFGERYPNVPQGDIRRWFSALKASLKSMVGMKLSPEDAARWLHYATTEAVPWKGVAVAKTGEERMQRGQIDDASYLKAVAAGDMETAQRMVDEAAKAAGYNEGPLYHVGQASWTEADRPVYTQDSKELADKFLKSLRRDYPEAQAKKLYAQMENPAVQGRDIERSSFLTSSELGKAQLAEAMGKGFDSVKGYYAGLGVPEYLTTKPNQIKLADPVTYDNAGNVIPLSERFNKQSSDIRYQRPTVGQAKEAVKAGLDKTLSEIDQITRRGGVYETVGRAMTRAYNTADAMLGKARSLGLTITKLNYADANKLRSHLYNEYKNQQLLTPAPEIAEAYKEWRTQAKPFWVAEANKAGFKIDAGKKGLRDRIESEYWFPGHKLSDEARDILASKVGTPEYQKLKDDYLRDAEANYLSQGKLMTEAQEKALVDFEEQRALNNKTFDPSAPATFAGSRKPMGRPLPESWIEKDFRKLYESYNARSAKDYAAQQHFEKSPEVMAALGSKKFFNGQDIPADVLQNTPVIAPDPSVQSVMREFSGQPLQMPGKTIRSFGAAASALALQTISRIGDVGGTVTKPLAYIGLGDYGAYMGGMAEKLSDWSKLKARSIESGLNNPNANQDFHQVIGMGQDAGKYMQKVLDGLGFITGSSKLESVARTLAQAQGEMIVSINKRKAATGDKDAVRFLDTLNNDWRTQSDMALAAQFGQMMQGTYDMRQLPAWFLEGGAAPYLTWSKWSMGQMNNFRKFAVEPAMQGNLKPLIAQVLVGMAGGGAIEQVQEWLSGKESKAVKWSELESWARQNEGKIGTDGGELLMQKFMIMAQKTGTFGFAGDLAMMPINALVGDTQSSVGVFPAAELFADGMKNVAGALTAIDKGEDVGLVLQRFGKNVIVGKTQMARVASTWIDEVFNEGSENLRSSDRRKARLFEELSGTGRSNGMFPVSYENLAEQKFERGSVTEDTGEEAFELVSRAREQATSPEDYASRIRKLKTSQNAIMPSLERQPMKAARYLGFVEGAEPGKGSETLKRYYTRQNEDKYRKSLIEGMSGIR